MLDLLNKSTQLKDNKKLSASNQETVQSKVKKNEKVVKQITGQSSLNYFFRNQDHPIRRQLQQLKALQLLELLIITLNGSIKQKVPQILRKFQMYRVHN